MLKVIRVTLAVLTLLCLTLLFVDVTGFAASHWAWMAKIQLVPAVLGLNIVVLAALAVATVLLGRVYCSVVCPLGIYQDVVNRIRMWTRRGARRGPFRYRPARNVLRLPFLTVFVFALAGGFFVLGAWVASFIDPYSAFGRMGTWLLRPGAVDVNNMLADAAAAQGSYAFARVNQLPLSIPLLIVASLTFLVVTVMAWRGGRDYCNTVCPVGTVLGFLSRFSWLKIRIDSDNCIRCGKCGAACKAQCIDTKNHKIDYSRCVACFDCIGSCSEGAITYGRAPKAPAAEADAAPQSGARRAMMVGGAIVAADLAMKAVAAAADGGLAPIKHKKAPRREVPVVPPGSASLRVISSRCTACQLCITSCPNGVLRPSTSPDRFMQPVMEFNDGYCRPECTRCSDVCPSDAIAPIDVAVKSSTKIGTAVVDASACISAAYGQSCGTCARNCPAGAIVMTAADGGHLRPVVNEALCIGCGSCEYHCPVGRAGNIRAEYPAIHVEGVEVHRLV